MLSFAIVANRKEIRHETAISGLLETVLHYLCYDLLTSANVYLQTHKQDMLSSTNIRLFIINKACNLV